MKQVGLALAQYTQDYDEKTPNALIYSFNGTWQNAVYSYTKSSGVWLCPSRGKAKWATSPYGYKLNWSTDAATGVPDPFYSCYSGNASSSNYYSPVHGAGYLAGGDQPVSLSEIQSPSTLIAVWESDNSGGFLPAELVDNNQDDMYTKDKMWAGHLSTSNYLFADGHVKSMRPLATVANNVNQWSRDNTQSGPSTPANSTMNYSVLMDRLNNASVNYR